MRNLSSLLPPRNVSQVVGDNDRDRVTWVGIDKQYDKSCLVDRCQTHRHIAYSTLCSGESSSNASGDLALTSVVSPRTYIMALRTRSINIHNLLARIDVNLHDREWLLPPYYLLSYYITKPHQRAE